MIIENVGKYRLLEDLSVRTAFSTGTLPKGALVSITQIDDVYHKVIGPELKDWRHWDIPVELINKGDQ